MSVAVPDDVGRAALDQGTLVPVVRQLLDDHTAEIVSWQACPILQGKASPAGVTRIAGTAQVQDTTVPWSLVLKELHASARSAYAGNNASDDPSSPWYWKRELLIYQSGLFDNLPEGLAAPRCYQIDEQPFAGNIWMEDVREEVGTVWPLAHYAEVARHFGRFNGMHLVGRPLPDWPWLLTHFLRSRVQKSEWPTFAAHYPQLRHSSALVQRGWDDDLVTAFAQIWQDRFQFLDTLERLPQTLIHNDSGRKNLFACYTRGMPETVAIDWGYAAIGALGEDLACLVCQPVYWFDGVHPDQMQELDALAFAGYVQGLHEAGWRGNPALARLGYTLSVVLRSGLGIFVFEWAAREHTTREFIETAIGHSIEEVADVMRGLRLYIVACADEARQLIASPAMQTSR